MKGEWYWEKEENNYVECVSWKWKPGSMYGEL